MTTLLYVLIVIVFIIGAVGGVIDLLEKWRQPPPAPREPRDETYTHAHIDSEKSNYELYWQNLTAAQKNYYRKNYGRPPGWCLEVGEKR